MGNSEMCCRCGTCDGMDVERWVDAENLHTLDGINQYAHSSPNTNTLKYYANNKSYTACICIVISGSLVRWPTSSQKLPSTYSRVNHFRPKRLIFRGSTYTRSDL